MCDGDVCEGWREGGGVEGACPSPTFAGMCGVGQAPDLVERGQVEHDHHLAQPREQVQPPCAGEGRGARGVRGERCLEGGHGAYSSGSGSGIMASTFDTHCSAHAPLTATKPSAKNSCAILVSCSTWSQ